MAELSRVNFLGYEAVFDNSVYSKDKATDGSDADLAVKEILLPGRYIEQSEGEVIAHIMETAKNVRGMSGIVLPKSTYFSPLEKEILKLPPKLRQRIIDRDEEILDKMGRYTLAPRIEGKDKPQYLRIRYGLIPEGVIEDNARSLSVDWYHKMFYDESLKAHDFGERYMMRILAKEGLLPEKKKVDSLVMEHGTWGSKTWEITPTNYNAQKVMEILDSLYSGLSSGHEIPLLEDITGYVIEEYSVPTIKLLQVSLLEDKMRKDDEEAERRRANSQHHN